MGGASVMTGLSPRLRGNRPGIRQRDCGQRSIPAPAGEPTSLMTCHSNGAVYPRACGGTMISMRTPSPPAGLSPRLRGNLEDYWALGLPKRSIPAPAGEPQHRKREAPLDRVYPRACGGTVRDADPRASGLGLSPRLRGNRVVAAWAQPLSRSIPAPAGEPPYPGARCCSCAVYPRACGGTMKEAGIIMGGQGLSPRLRGNHS